jgi:hypothetical protein
LNAKNVSPSINIDLTYFPHCFYESILPFDSGAGPCPYSALNCCFLDLYVFPPLVTFSNYAKSRKVGCGLPPEVVYEFCTISVYLKHEFVSLGPACDSQHPSNDFLYSFNVCLP